MTPEANPEGTRSQRWLARLSFVLAGAAIVILALFAGLKGLAILAVALAAAVVSLVAAFFFLSRRGILRWLSLVVFALVPIAVIVYYAFRNVLWVAIASAAAWLLASMTARVALAGNPRDARMPEHPAEPPARHPYVIMNPKSGGGKVERFDLKRKAEDLGAEVFLIGGPEPVDVAKVARDAVARGADLLSVAGGDGTQALVAGVAAEHGIPFVVISAGTRNHFALDLGLDREDPAACLGALSDGVELRVDLGMINGQVFVNNASFGAYAEIVETPAYRGDKLKTTLNLLPDLLQGQGGARLIAQSDDAEIRSPQALLVANNPYGTGDVAGLSRRARLDGGLLGVVQLQDIVKGGIRERFAELRRMGIRTVMITGDNPMTAAAIAAEAGVDDFLAQATPEDKLKLIRDEQAKGKLVAMCGDGTNDAPALAQADVGVAMNTGTQAAREAGNMVDLDSNPTKLIEVVEIGKQLLMTRGALTTFSIANDVAKYFAIIPAMFLAFYPQLAVLNVMQLASPQSAILSAIIFNALIIIALIPLALKGVAYRAIGAGALLRRNLLVYGLGGIIVPFFGIKAIDVAVAALHLV